MNLLRRKCDTKAIAVQYKTNGKTRIGGGGSGNANKNNKGLSRINLIGNIMVDTMLFQTIGDSDPGKGSPFRGKSRTSVPRSELEIN